MIAEPLTGTNVVALLAVPLGWRSDRKERKAQLYERELWKLGRKAQAGDAEALAAYLALLHRYERLVNQ